MRNIGTISQSDNSVCNLLFRNKDINGDAYLLASGDKAVSYNDASAGAPTKYSWTIPGGTPASSSDKDIKVNYKTAGVFDLPTLEVTTSEGVSSYNPGLKIKAGGVSEISTIDCREWMTTYLLGALPFSDGNGGYLGGTNSKDLVGYGNLFMLGTEDAYMTGVNVYLPHKPTKFKEGASLKAQVWMTDITETDIVLTSLPVEGAILPMADIRTKDDGAWVPVKGGAVAEFKFSEPLSLYGKTVFFVSIEGFSNDPATEDFCMLTDLVGKPLNEEQLANRLCHNSFARLKGENDYLRPISSYGGGTGSFAICPLISIPGVSGGVAENAADGNGFRVVSANGDAISVYSTVAGQLEVYNMLGRKVAGREIAEGSTSLALDGLDGGVYIVKGPNGKSVKIIL